MSFHEKLSPSARHRWGVCSASVAECAKYPEQPSGPAAIDGTHSHTLLETCIRTGLSASSFIGQELSDHEGSFVVDDDRAERVQFALDYIADTEGEGYQIISEKRVDPKYLTSMTGLSGTVDVQLIGKNWIEIIDYKDGMNPVDAAGNHQMEQYALGVVGEMQPEERVDIETITMTIIQPKLRMKGMKGISSHTITMQELLDIVPVIQAEVRATMDNPQFVPGEAQCKYCAAKGGCSALVNHTLAASGIGFEDISQQAADKEPTTMSDEEILKIMESAPLIRQMLDGVEAEALRRFEAGQNIAGLKMVRGNRGRRGWAMDEEKTAAVLKKFNIPTDVIWKKTLISPTQVETVRWTKRNGEEVTLSERQLKMLKTEYIKQSDGKLTVALESDSRPSVTISTAGMFAPVESAVPSWLS